MVDSTKTVEEMRQDAFEQLDKLAEARQKNTYSFAELWEKKDDKIPFLIPELLPSSSVTAFIGEDGIGKTQILTQLAEAVAMKYKSFLGQELHSKHHAVLIVATEDSKEKFISAAAKQLYYLEGNKIDPKGVNIRFTEGANFDDLGEFFREITDNLKTQPCDVVMIDALSDLFTLIDGEINSNTHARRILSALQKIATDHETSIIVIHHAAKTKIVGKRKEGKMFLEKTDSQGAGAITQKPRTIWGLTNDPKSASQDGRTYTNYLHVLKANLMSKHFHNNAMQLTFDTSTLLHEFVDLVDIQMMENPDPDSGPQETPGNGAKLPKKRADEYSAEEHQGAVNRAFENFTTLDYNGISKALKFEYGCGDNKIKQKGGILSVLIENGFVIQDQNTGYYKKAPEPEPQKIIPATQIDLPLNENGHSSGFEQLTDGTPF